MLNNIEKLDLNTLAHICGGQTTKRHPKKRSGRVANSTGHSSLLSWIGNICFIGCAAYVIIDLFKGYFITPTEVSTSSTNLCPGYTQFVAKIRLSGQSDYLAVSLLLPDAFVENQKSLLLDSNGKKKMLEISLQKK